MPLKKTVHKIRLQFNFSLGSIIVPMRVLVVEDEHRIANTIKKGLEQERYAVDVCYDGVAGFDMAASEEYDVIILDLMLPGMDGMTICRKLRDQDIHTPILILSARSMLDDKIEGLDSGADDYLPKPFAFAELVARVRALARRPKKTLTTTLVVGDLKLDTSTYTVEKRGSPVTLTAREFALLEYLMRHVNTPINKDQIIAHVWNYDANVLPNTVEVYVRNLRQKLGERMIETMRGFGYKLVKHV